MSEQEQNITAENESVESSDNAGEAPTPEVTEGAAETSAEASPETQEEAQEKVNSSDETDEPTEAPAQPKETRAERRIRQLVDKNKDLSKKLEKLSEFESDQPFAKPLDDSPLITQEELVEGVDPKVLEERIESRIEAKVNATLSQKDRVERYRKDVEGAISDLEGTIKAVPELDEDSDSYDPVFAEAFLNTFNDVNYANGSFMPRRKASEIASSLKALAERSGTRKAAEVTAKVARQAQDSAIKPDASEPESADYELEQARQRATSTGRDEDWAKVLKRMTSLPK